MDGESDEPLLSVDDFDQVATNDEWAFRRADWLVEQNGMGRRRRDTDRRTESEVFDRPTLLIIHRLLIHGTLKSLDFPVSTGKEANVFRGSTPRGGYLAVKIYRVNTATFKHVLQYIQGDERFQGVTGDKRALVHAWCQKEFRNLLRMRGASVPVPEPLKANNNVLVTEYLGTAKGPFPKLREINFDLASPEDKERLYRQAVSDYLAMHNKADLIHADWSEYNVLVENADGPASGWRLRPIDVGQAVLKNHPMANEFLQRDVKNMMAFFSRKGAHTDAKDILGQLNFTRGGEEE